MSQIKHIQFGILNEETISNLSVGTITNSHVSKYENKQKPNTCIDARLGTNSRFHLCGTCNNSLETCPCHIGKLDLKIILPNVLYIPYNIKVLNQVCFNCSHHLMKGAEIPKNVKTINYCFDECNKSRNRKRTPLFCSNPECGLPQPKFYFEEPFICRSWNVELLENYFKIENLLDSQIYEDFKFFINQPFCNRDACVILESIPEEDLKFMGIDPKYAHPKGYFMKSLVVPALSIRPTYYYQDDGKPSGYNIITRRICDIITKTKKVETEAQKQNINFDTHPTNEYPEKLAHLIYILYHTVSNYFQKDKCKIPRTKFKLNTYESKSHSKSEDISKRFKGKEGFFRSNIMGKRTNFNARTIVTPNSDLDIDQVGIPQSIARNLTIPKRISQHTRQKLTKLMKEGHVKNLRNPKTGDMIAINDANKDKIVLIDGWDAELYLRNNDLVLFNRQPTLHKKSIMAHRVHIHTGRTFQCKQEVVGPYNADFDGKLLFHCHQQQA